jgi:hypothetical protein
MEEPLEASVPVSGEHVVLDFEDEGLLEELCGLLSEPEDDFSQSHDDDAHPTGAEDDDMVPQAHVADPHRSDGRDALDRSDPDHTNPTPSDSKEHDEFDAFIAMLDEPEPMPASAPASASVSSVTTITPTSSAAQVEAWLTALGMEKCIPALAGAS